MPRLKARYDHTEIYRPNGTPYAEGEFEMKSYMQGKQRIVYAVTHALTMALENFENEFGELPLWARDPRLAPFAGSLGVVETIVSGELVRVTVFDIPPDSDDEESHADSSGS